MAEGTASPRIAIVDYGMGNLHSVRQACLAVDLDAVITNSPADLKSADAVIVPGIGGFPDAMRTLQRDRLVDPILHTATSGKPLVGICLGMQLLMQESDEFGRHEGLGLIPGRVERFPLPGDGQRWKIPQVGWNRLTVANGREPDSWEAAGLRDGDSMYFVHSYYVRPDDTSVIAARSSYAGIEFCAALTRGNLLGWQFHPERSGPRGLALYRALSRHILNLIRA